MSNHLRNALRAAHLRRIPWTTGLDRGKLDRFGARHLCAAAAASSWHVQETSSSGALSGAASVGRSRIQLRPLSAAPAAHEVENLSGDETEDEVDWKLKQMEKRTDVRTAQRAFLDYLHVTRGICFSDAEHMSKRSPIFLMKLLEEVKDAANEPAEAGEELNSRSKVKKRELRDMRVSKALGRFFNFHPVNEFEPFLESIGIKPSEYDSLLPRDLMFLSDDEVLLENYRVLCNYGIARTKIGRIYRDAMEVFTFGQGVLASKLKALEDLGLSKTSVIKLVISSPVILVRDPIAELKILQWLDDVGIERDWLGQFLSAKKCYNWGKMVEVLQFFSDLGFTKEGIGKLVRKNPDFLFHGSGKMLFTVVLIMLKAGSGKKELFDLFLDFPNLHAENFTRNLQRGIVFLNEIGLCEEDIKKFVICNGSILGSAPVKRANSILTHLSVGKKRLRKMIMEEPHRMMEYALGSKLSRLPKLDLHEKALREKVKFLESIGFVEGSDEMKRAVKTFRGKGAELQNRYDFLVKSGFDPNDVANMIKLAPQVLNQKIHVLESKISFLVNESKYPLSALLHFPAYLSFTVQRTRVRLSMYNWLQERGVVTPQLALSTILACSDRRFMSYFVEKHPMGPEVWDKLQTEVASTKRTCHVTPSD